MTDSVPDGYAQVASQGGAVLPPPAEAMVALGAEQDYVTRLLGMNPTAARIEAAVRWARESSRQDLHLVREQLARRTAHLEEMIGHVRQRGWTRIATAVLVLLLGALIPLIIEHWSDGPFFAVGGLVIEIVILAVVIVLMVGQQEGARRARDVLKELTTGRQGD